MKKPFIITIASGKGGTGKTTVATSLTKVISLKKVVSHIDFDVEEPNSNIFLKVNVEKKEEIRLSYPAIDRQMCDYCGLCQEVCEYNAIVVFRQLRDITVFDHLCKGCSACWRLCPKGAISEQSRRIGIFSTGKSDGIVFYEGKLNIGERATTAVIRWMKRKIAIMNSSDVIVIDAPPGTSCPVVHSMKDADYVVLVTEDTPFGLFDLKLAVALARNMNKPIGIIINKALEGFNDVREFAADEKIPIIMQIPFDRGFAQSYAKGVVLTDYSDKYRQEFENLFPAILKATAND